MMQAWRDGQATALWFEPIKAPRPCQLLMVAKAKHHDQCRFESYEGTALRFGAEHGDGATALWVDSQHGDGGTVLRSRHGSDYG